MLSRISETLTHFWHDTVENISGKTKVFLGEACESFSAPDGARCPIPSDHCTLRVLTHNTWGLPVAPHLTDRITLFCQHLSDFDVVVLQEMARPKEKERLQKAAMEAGLLYSYCYLHGVGFPGWANVDGGGLLILSRYPIVESMYRKYSVNGKPHKIIHADFFGDKGVGLCRILTPVGPVDLYLSHLHADYTDNIVAMQRGDIDEYLAQRTSQAFECAQFIRATRRSPLCVLCTDLNFRPDSVGYRLQRDLARLTDAWGEFHPGEPGYTNGAPDNTFSDANSLAQRIDYLFYNVKEPKQPGMGKWRVEGVEIQKWFGDVRGKRMSASDHFGLSATFTYSAPHNTVINSSLLPPPALTPLAPHSTTSPAASSVVSQTLSHASPSPIAGSNGYTISNNSVGTGTVLTTLTNTVNNSGSPVQVSGSILAGGSRSTSRSSSRVNSPIPGSKGKSGMGYSLSTTASNHLAGLANNNSGDHPHHHADLSSLITGARTSTSKAAMSLFDGDDNDDNEWGGMARRGSHSSLNPLNKNPNKKEREPLLLRGMNSTTSSLQPADPFKPVSLHTAVTEHDESVLIATLEETASILEHGTINATDRRRNHWIRAFIASILLGFINFAFFFQVVLVAYTLVELLISFFVVKCEIKSLTQTLQNVKIICNACRVHTKWHRDHHHI